jgi:hypothetical protein
VTDRAPGRYCLAVCYCGDCDHYKPIRRTSERDDLETYVTTKPTDSTWATRDEPTWIDNL